MPRNDRVLAGPAEPVYITNQEIAVDITTALLDVLVTNDVLTTRSAYGLNDFEEVSSVLAYIGKQDVEGAWLLQELDTTAGVVLRYASVVNNPGVVTYANAWAGRAGLTYGLYAEVFA